jgi:hypothetical protein
MLIGAMGLALMGPVAITKGVGSDHPCRGALESLVREWNAIGYQTPAKPAVAHVAGRNGHDATGGQVTYMQTQIRLALADCDKGDVAEVMRRVAMVHNLLAASRNSG